MGRDICLNSKHSRTFAVIAMAFCLPMLFTGCSESSEKLVPLEMKALAVPPTVITLKILNYCPEARHRFAEFFLVNESLKIDKNGINMDWDRDALPNLIDNSLLFDIDYRTADTNDDGYSDLVMYVAGIEKNKQVGLRYCGDHEADMDFDGLNDCEERLLKTGDTKFDSDGDLIPDKIEVRSGLNPLDSLDASQDPDNDGLSNLEEVKRGTPIMESENGQTQLLAMVYSVETNANCFDLKVENIPVAQVSNGNSLRLSFVEAVEPAASSGGSVPAASFEMRDYVKTVDRSIENKTEIEMEYSDLQEAKGK